jgi:hypothetical protein
MSELGVEHFSFVNCYHDAGLWDKHSVDRKFLTELFCAAGTPDDHDERKRWYVIALGNEVSNVLRYMRVDHFTMPHPSYRNRKLNDPNYERDRINSCKRWLMD